jgi:hypothetical protein
MSPSTAVLDEINSYATFFLGLASPGLHFTNAPASGKAITANYSIDSPFHTANNIMNFTYTIVFSRG